MDSASQKESVSFVIPCYGSEQTIAGVVDEIIQTVAERQDRYDYEIILVNDNSPDNVWQVIRTLAQNNPRIKAVSLARNFGQHAALMAGFRYVDSDFVVCLDDDGQTPANAAFSLVDELYKGCNIVYAKYRHKQHSVMRNLGSRLNDMMARAMLNKPKNLSMMSYFACKRFIVDEAIKYTNPFPYVGGLMLRASNKAVNVEVEHRDRAAGHSGYSFRKLASLWINGFTSFSVKPLRIASFLGMAVALIGFIYGTYIIVNKIINPVTPLGYSSTMAALLFIGGMIMLILGMIGEYIGRIYISLNNSPQYVVEQTINLEKKINGGV